MVLDTKSEILKYLERVYTGTEKGISRALGMTKADIHYHLNLLLAEGIIVREKEINPNNGRGRPRYIYRQKQVKPNKMIDHLLRVLLKVHLHDQDLVQLDRNMDLFAEQLFPNADPGKNFSMSLKNLMSLLGEFNYRPGWEAHQEGPHIIFHQCPYPDLVNAFPELCSLDMAILKHLTNHPVKPIWKLHPGTSFSMCAFSIQHLAYSVP
jgi:predicted ArsR family transcriptional regulator